MTVWHVLFYGGIALMVTAALGAVASAAVLRISGKRLRKRLEEESGINKWKMGALCPE